VALSSKRGCMSTLKKSDYYGAGLAIFSMFFGAGNIIFPLALGNYALDKTFYGISGLLITAVIMPFAGLLAMFLYQGQIQQFFGRLGKIPGLIVAFLIISLLGPFGSTPRCIALAYSTLKISFPFLSSVYFSAGACLIIYFLSYKKRRLLGLLGYTLTPALILLLTILVVKGFWDAPVTDQIELAQSNLTIFFHGLNEGYNTMDLLAAFFFAPLVLSSLSKKEVENQTSQLTFVLKASAIGASLLALVYISFGYLAFYYAGHLEGDVAREQLLSTIAIQVLGPYAGFMIGLIVVLACLTTAMALIAAFTGFVHKEICAEKISYQTIMIGGLILTFFIATFEFSGISQFLGPILQSCYPFLILLTAYNLTIKLYELRLANIRSPKQVCDYI